MFTLKQKLNSDKILKGTHVGLSDPCICELIANLGFDFIWIDTEHSAIDYGMLVQHLIPARAGGTSSIVRIPWNDPVLAKRVMEMGPDGIILPMINTSEEAVAAMSCTLYPLLGTRGCGPLRTARYGDRAFEDYRDIDSREICRIIQIESETAVQNLEQILQIPAIDLVIVGPFDLSGSVGELGNIFGKRTSDLIDRAIALTKQAGKPVGVSTGADDQEALRYWRDKGFNVISACGNFSYIGLTKKSVSTDRL